MRPRNPFLLGVMLTLAASLVWGSTGLSAGSAWRVEYMLLGAFLTFLVFYPPNLVLQGILYGVLRWIPGVKPVHRNIILNLPMACVLAYCCVAVCHFGKGESVFREWVMDPIPSSIEIVQWGVVRPVGETKIGIAIEGEASDLNSIIESGHFRREPLSGENEILHLKILSSRLKTQTGIDVRLEVPFGYYPQGLTRNYMLCNSNQTRGYLYLRD